LDVPSLGIGTIAWLGKKDEDKARIAAVAAGAKARGLNFFDTAERYGATPLSLIPAALAGLGLPVDKSYLGGDCESNLAIWGRGASVATKFTPTPTRRQASDVVDAARLSRARLGVDSIDLYQLHMPDVIQPLRAFGVVDSKDEIYWDGLAECYHLGLVKNVGVSNYGASMLERAQEHLARRGVPLASNQIAFNLLYQRDGSLKSLRKGEELGIKTLAYYPLAMGLLTGKLVPSNLRRAVLEKKISPQRAADLCRYLEGGSGGTAGHIPPGGIRPLLAVLTDVAASRSKTPAQVSLNWILCKGALPIAGASSLTQIEDNVDALGWRLTADEVGLLDEAAEALPFDFKGCGFQTTDSKFVGYGFERWTLH
jgi:pyridoxine 4-dehydrogenase